MSDDELPKIHVGRIDEKPVDLNDAKAANDGEGDDDHDDDKVASPLLVAILGLDPADL